MSAPGRIVVFAKPPIPGTVKTRLSASVGADHAAALAGAFLQDTWALATSVAWARAVLATTDGAPGDFALPDLHEVWLQGEGDLGKRMERVARRGLEEAGFVVIIGADSPGLPARILECAREALTEADAVLGPSDDGGFYLVGLRRCPEGLFDDLPWSAETTFTATRERIEARSLALQILEPWFDVDVPADLARLRAALERGVIDAPYTMKLLNKMPCAGR